MGSDIVCESPNIAIEDVLLVEGFKHNLLSIIQLCEKCNELVFDSSICMVIISKNKQTIYIKKRSGNTYNINFDILRPNDACCLISKEEELWLWHIKITRIHMDLISKLIPEKLVIGLPLKYSHEPLK